MGASRRYARPVPTRKQRRRLQKQRRHEWEEVWVDSEGRELDSGAVESTAPSPNGKRQATKAAPVAAGRGRAVQPPSWQRVLKRGLIFAPLMFVTVHLITGDELTMAQKVAQTAFLLLLFLPFSYVMDAVTYRVARRRAGSAGTTKS